MNKLVPFNKDLFFKTNVSEITSISLEKEVEVNNNIVSGTFILEGDYKLNSDDVDKELFNFKIPYEIKLDDKYILDNLEVEISDFYYELKDNKILSVYIELKLLNLEEKVEENEYELEERCIEEEEVTTITEENDFVTYKIYIVKDNDNVDTIMNKYSVSKEELESYNDLSNIKLGDKIIIPTNVKNS